MRTRAVSMVLTLAACSVSGLMLGAMGGRERPVADARATPAVMPARPAAPPEMPSETGAAAPRPQEPLPTLPPEPTPVPEPAPAPDATDEFQAIEPLLIEILEQH